MSEDDILSDAERKALLQVMQTPQLPAQCALIVDDDQDARELLSEIFMLNGIHCLTAASGSGALELLEADRSIGLLITDLRMADDGLDLVRKIRESERAALPIIIVSGNAEVRDAIDAMHLSVVDFLLKPIDAEHLLKLARRELGLQA